jgi:hypothetical protein
MNKFKKQFKYKINLRKKGISTRTDCVYSGELNCSLFVFSIDQFFFISHQYILSLGALVVDGEIFFY